MAERSKAGRGPREIQLDPGVGGAAARKKAREAARGYLDEIDGIARRMLGLAAAPAVPIEETAETEAGEEEAEMAE